MQAAHAVELHDPLTETRRAIIRIEAYRRRRAVKVKHIISSYCAAYEVGVLVKPSTLSGPVGVRQPAGPARRIIFGERQGGNPLKLL